MKLFSNLKKFGSKIALIEKDKKISFNELETYKRGIHSFKPNSLVLLINDNSFESLKFYIVLMKLDKISLMLIDNNTNINSVNETINVYKHEYIILPKSKFKFIKKDAEIISVDGHYLLLKSNKFNNLIKINHNNKLMLTTSGTLGSSKFVKLSNENLKFNSNQIIKYLNIKKNDQVITTMPVSYSYMLSIINTHLDSGCTIHLNNKSIFQREFWEYFKKKKINSFSGVPYHFQILEKNNFKFLETSSLKYITCAGGKLEKRIINKIYKFCIAKKLKFFLMYGQTEASPRISYLPFKYLKQKTESIGRGIEGTKLWVEDHKKKQIKTCNKIGELVCKGNNIFNGYSDSRKDLSKKITNNKILRTGDLAYFDKDKFFYIFERKSRLAKIFGIRINLDELEKKLSNKSEKVLCKAGINKIYLYTTKSYKKNLMTKAEKITLQNKSAFEVKILYKFPRTNSGKIKYSLLKTNEDQAQ